MAEIKVRITKNRVEKVVCGGGRSTRAWFVEALKIVHADTGKDMMQPWITGRGKLREAREHIKRAGWTLTGEIT